ncbi:protein disulfide isomerase [Cavenderia fasciculata]|uniref:Protein disulfide-isomerase n=1 Tax=Cavenderia fasciculata TaxID=261658 RepID=F4PHX2_CACFS|nr:protein disulfide isomerase [Cavenderia fasciculata]EGG25306.1 protein disulfide isomerase [Cavenderia fasciculata]|eukprot:XP_004363157.1 protein disulfide isomerase [Cavenderia fasciculata]
MILLAACLFLAAINAHPGHSHHHDSDDEEEETDVKSHVMNLNEENFAQTIAEHDVALVMFFAPWCGHCKNLKPHFAEASNKLASNEKIALAKVDCTVEETLCQLNKVKHYPTLVIYNNGVPEPWEGERTAKGIEESVLAELLPPVTSISSEEELIKFNEANPVSVVGFFDNDHDDRYAQFKTIVGKLKKFAKFGSVVNKEFASKYASKSPSVVVFKKDQDKSEFANADFEVEELVKFIRYSILPLVGEINGQTYKKYDGAGLPLVYLFINPADADAKEAVLAAATPVAKKALGKAIFCWVDHSKYPQQAKYMGLSGDVVPSAAIEVAAKAQKFLKSESEEFNLDTFDKFIGEFLADKLEPFVKSEPIPEDNNGPVKVVVAKTYNEIVLDTTKDVLVEFYAPWCGHCKNLEPIYKQLGEHFATTAKSVVIAKIDATANDVPSELGITGFPTILYFRANDKTPLSFEGHRDFDSLSNFVSSNASVEKHAETQETTQEQEPVKTTTTEETAESKPSHHDEL